MTLALHAPGSPKSERKRLTTADLLAMPDDGVERWLIRGELREGGLTRRNPKHSRGTSRFSQKLLNWLDAHPEMGGLIVDGEAGFQLTEEPDSTCGIDVAYVSSAVVARTPDNASLIQGPPVLAVEILSPSDTQEAILEKVDEYLRAGVKLVWIVEPVYKTITVYRPDAEPETFNLKDTISAEPHLPGFVLPVAELFS